MTSMSDDTRSHVRLLGQSTLGQFSTAEFGGRRLGEQVRDPIPCGRQPNKC